MGEKGTFLCKAFSVLTGAPGSTVLQRPGILQEGPPCAGTVPGDVRADRALSGPSRPQVCSPMQPRHMWDQFGTKSFENGKNGQFPLTVLVQGTQARVSA